MKKILKKMTVSLTATLMLCGSTYVTLGSVSATDNDIQPRGTYHVYGDVNNDGEVDPIDVSNVVESVLKFENLTGDSRLPLSYAVARPEVYYLKVPQAADVDGDGYITNDDVRMISYYSHGFSNNVGRCGQTFYIN